MGETGPPGMRGEKGEMGLSGPTVSSDSDYFANNTMVTTLKTAES